tara:strand:+ start:1157 stop:1759 length:603 start_codon:yes stop_codon:yes gene_type:complete
LTAVAAIVPTFTFTHDTGVGKGSDLFGGLFTSNSHTDSVLVPASDVDSTITRSSSDVAAAVPKPFALKNSTTYGKYSIDYFEYVDLSSGTDGFYFVLFRKGKTTSHSQHSDITDDWTNTPTDFFTVMHVIPIETGYGGDNPADDSYRFLMSASDSRDTTSITCNVDNALTVNGGFMIGWNDSTNPLGTVNDKKFEVRFEF